jgi:hypothetical protein
VTGILGEIDVSSNSAKCIERIKYLLYPKAICQILGAGTLARKFEKSSASNIQDYAKQSIISL